MKLKSGFELHEVCGEKVIIAQGIENLDFSKLIHLNETAAFLWETAKDKDFTAESLTDDLLAADYDVDRETAFNDIEALITEWKKHGLVE